MEKLRNILKVIYYNYNPRSEIVSKIKGLPVHNILEVGCGKGETLCELRRQYPGAKIKGIEPFAVSPVFDNVEIIDFENFFKKNFDDEKFDLVIFADVLEHIWDYERFLDLSSLILDSKGYLCVSVPNIKFLPAMFKILFKDEFPEMDGGIFDRDHRRWFTRKKILEIIKNNNFAIRGVFGINSLVDVQPNVWRKFAAMLLGPLIFFLFNRFYYQQWLIIAQKA